MISIHVARQLALQLPEAEEKSHFDKPDFRIRNKIFASLPTGKNCMMVKLSNIDQSVFCAIDPKVIYPVPGGWGRSGATLFDLTSVKKPVLRDALTCAWKLAAPATLVKKYFPGDAE